MFEKNPMTLVLIVVIIIMAFILYCGNNPDKLKNPFKTNKSGFEGSVSASSPPT